LQELLGKSAKSIKSEKREALQYYLSTGHAVEVFSTWFGPTLNALEKIDESRHEDLLNSLKEVFERYNRADDGTAVVENIYLQSIVQL